MSHRTLFVTPPTTSLAATTSFTLKAVANHHQEAVLRHRRGFSVHPLKYLEDRYPQNPFLPHDIHKRAINFQAANIVYSSIQPFQNFRLMKYIKEKISPEEAQSWARSAIEKGFEALEKLLKDHAGRYATGDELFLADLFLAPQINSAFKLSNIDMVVFYPWFTGGVPHSGRTTPDI